MIYGRQCTSGSQHNNTRMVMACYQTQVDPKQTWIDLMTRYIDAAGPPAEHPLHVQLCPSDWGMPMASTELSTYSVRR